jgi:hypothetical protein
MHLLILILGMGLYIMEGWQIILLVDNQEPKCFILAMHTNVDEFIWLIFYYRP